jgi:hypothetical protein
MSYIDKLISNCELAKKSIPVREFVMSNISELNGIDEAIYIIEQIEGDPRETFLKFSTYKESTKRSCAKLNSPSNVMYVGSSTTGLKKRIKQHEGCGSESTYALHLSHWFDGKYTIKIKQYDVLPAVLQIIEDSLSDELKPAFGKKGSNGK